MAGHQGRKIYDDRRWKALRRRILAEEPLCRECNRRGTVEAAVELDHIRAIRAGGPAFDESNLQPLCRVCHNLKTAMEKYRFRGQSKAPLVDIKGVPHGKQRTNTNAGRAEQA